MKYPEPTDIASFFNAGMDRELYRLHNRANVIGANIIGLHLNVGAGNKQIEGNIDLDLPDWDADTQPIPYQNDSVIVINAFHFLEHVYEPVRVLLEFQRVLKPGGLVNICVPYYSSSMAFQDLDHKHFFTENTWRILFSNHYYNKNQIEWRFKVGLNIIMGIEERCLCLLTQLIKE
jgi:SAM-dependent methyltransferase